MTDRHRPTQRADRGLCADRRLPDRGAGGAGRQHRLAVLAPIRQRRLLRGPARHRRERAVPDRAGVGGKAAATRRYRAGHADAGDAISTTESGEVTLIDFMVPERRLRHAGPHRRGPARARSTMTMELRCGSTTAQSVPWVTKRNGGNGIVAVAGPDMVVLRTHVALRGEDMRTRGRFRGRAGERVAVRADPLRLAPASADRHRCRRRAVSDRGVLGASGRRGRPIRASGPMRQPLAADVEMPDPHGVTGGIVAAPTTSLPEEIGGVRNWDYRFCWLRDASLTLFAFMGAGLLRARPRAGRRGCSAAWRAARRKLQIMYGIAGERRLEERDAAMTFRATRGRVPVRIGNAAVGAGAARRLWRGVQRAEPGAAGQAAE